MKNLTLKTFFVLLATIVSLNTMAHNEKIIEDVHHEYIDVLGSKMHVQISGKGDPILFIHGNPSNGLIWRNITPHVKGLGQIIVPDLIGMGKSDKPDIDYSYEDQYKYLDALIKKLKLKNITLVLHDWGSGLGFNYFAKNPENIKAVAFMEGIIQDVGTFFPKETQDFFYQLRGKNGWDMIGEQNLFLQNVLPTWIIRDMSEDEFEIYRDPFKTVKSRKPIHAFVSEVPLNGEPTDTAATVKNYREKLQQSSVPKLFFYVTPGAFMPEPVANWIKKNIPNLRSIHLGEGAHFIQEDHPDAIGLGIKEWILDNRLNK